MPATRRHGLLGLATLLVSLLASACSDESPEPTPDPEPEPLPAVAPMAGELLIEELYYSGAQPP